MQAYEQLHPLILADMMVDDEAVLETGVEGEGEDEEEEKMRPSSDWMIIEEPYTQTNPMADPDASFNRFLQCWPPLAPYQRRIQSSVLAVGV